MNSVLYLYSYFADFLSEHVLLLRSQNINMKDLKARNENKHIEK